MQPNRCCRGLEANPQHYVSQEAGRHRRAGCRIDVQICMYVSMYVYRYMYAEAKGGARGGPETRAWRRATTSASASSLGSRPRTNVHSKFTLLALLVQRCSVYLLYSRQFIELKATYTGAQFTCFASTKVRILTRLCAEERAEIGVVLSY